MTTVSVAAAKDRLTELLREVEQGRLVRISRRGVVVAVLLAESEYARLATAASGSDFRQWLDAWRARLPADFDGISAEELSRWHED